MSLKHQACDQCQAAVINGVFCHETGCPNIALQPRQCRECGQVFKPESRFHVVGPCCTDTDEHECDSDGAGLQDCDLCRECGEHAGFCSVCRTSDCCGA